MRVVQQNCKWKKLVLFVILCLLVSCLLFFGWRPRGDRVAHRPLFFPEAGSVRFLPSSMAYVDALRIPAKYKKLQEFTLHVVFAPNDFELKGFRPILTIHDGQDAKQLIVWNWGRSIIVMNGDDYDGKKKWSRIVSTNQLQVGIPTLLSVVSSSRGTFLYLDGVLVSKKLRWRLSAPLDGIKSTLIMGNSMYGVHGWVGELFAVQFLAGASTSERIAMNYHTWKMTGRLHDEAAKSLFYYEFFQGDDGVVCDLSPNSNDLVLSESPLLFKHYFFQSSKQNVYSQYFRKDALRNLLGFVPWGIVVSLWLGCFCSLRPLFRCVVVTASGFGLSFCIELVQAWIPGRVSSLIDLFHNTLGSFLGCLFVMVFQVFYLKYSSLKLNSLSKKRP